MVLLGVLFLSAFLIAIITLLITKSLIISGAAMVFSVGFGCIGGLISPYIQSWIRNRVIEKIEQTLLSVTKGKKKYKINRQRYEDLRFTQNVFIFQSVLALIGAFVLYISIYKFQVLYLVIMGFLIILVFYTISYYKSIRNDIFNDLIDRL